jgi:large subunit ribosomal protein L30e
MRSGKSTLGYKTVLKVNKYKVNKKAIRNGKAKLVFISSNCPTVRKS